MTSHASATAKNNLAELRALVAAQEAGRTITNSEELAAARIADAEDAVTAAEAKVAKLQSHLDGALAGVEEAKAELAAVRAADHVYEAPQEAVVAGAVRASR